MNIPDAEPKDTDSTIMVVCRFFWKLLGVCVAVQYFYWAVMFTGAWLNLNAVPIVSLDWMALGFLGAAILAIDVAFPSLGGGAS